MRSLFSKKLNASSLLGGLFSKETSILGIDVGSATLKVIQIRKEKERAVLETYGELSTAAYSGGEPGRAAIITDEKASEMIRDLKQEAGATATKGLISIPLRYTFVTVIDMPTMSDIELSDAIQFEARRYIPVPLSEVVLDWWKIPTSSEVEGSKKKVSILLAAVQKDIVNKHQRIMDGAGIETVGFEIEAFSATRALGSRIRSAYLLFDIGALSTKIAVIDQGIVRSVHHVERASQAFSLAISQSLGIDFERAEKMKRDIGISQRPEAAGVRTTITPLLDSIFDEADRLRRDYRRKTNIAVDKAVLIGGGSLMPGFVEYAIEKLGIEVVLANPFNQLEYPAFLQPTLKEIAPSFTIATGLGLRGLNTKK